MSLFLLRLGELTLKKGTRPAFERKLKDNIKKRLKGKIRHFDQRDGRYYITVADEDDQQTEQVLSTTFGLAASHRCHQCPKEYDAMAKLVLKEAERLYRAGKSFKIEAKRTDKSFQLSSYELAAELGGLVLEHFPQFKVDVHQPDCSIYVEVRHQTFVYGEDKNYHKGKGGLPVGMAGRGLLLLSGGLDSPVAGWMMAKRGLFLSAVHFYTPPYTSEEALDKARRLAQKLAPWNVGFIDFYPVNFTPIQLKINALKKSEYTTLLGRACMMRIAAKIAEKLGAGALITGEALSQVASQTLESLYFTNAMSGSLVLRPCIGMDKQEIITIANAIDAFDIASESAVDCCSLFAPTHPVIHPNFAETKALFESAGLEQLIEAAAAAAVMEKVYE